MMESMRRQFVRERRVAPLPGDSLPWKHQLIDHVTLGGSDDLGPVEHHVRSYFFCLARRDRRLEERISRWIEFESTVFHKRKQHFRTLSSTRGWDTVDTGTGARAACSFHRCCSRAEAAWVAGVRCAAQPLRPCVVTVVRTWSVGIAA